MSWNCETRERSHQTELRALFPHFLRDDVVFRNHFVGLPIWLVCSDEGLSQQRRRGAQDTYLAIWLDEYREHALDPYAGRLPVGLAHWNDEAVWSILPTILGSLGRNKRCPEGLLPLENGTTEFWRTPLWQANGIRSRR